jgi:hypothetical protein
MDHASHPYIRTGFSTISVVLLTGENENWFFTQWTFLSLVKSKLVCQSIILKVCRGHGGKAS